MGRWASRSEALLPYVSDFGDSEAAGERRFDDEQRTLTIGKTYSGCPD
jgi:hypothetical protein